MDPILDELHRATAAIQARVGSTVTELKILRALTSTLFEEIAASGRRPIRSDLSGLDVHLRKVLAVPDRAMDGIGVVTTASYLTDSEYWLEWWRLNSRGGSEFVAHILNPNQDAFYDYASRSWFADAVRTGHQTITGPYVDAGGTNAYTVTIALPMTIGDTIVGVTGSDIHASRFESDLLSVHARSPLVLVNHESRVIASSSASHLPGDIFPEDQRSDWNSATVELCPGKRGHWQILSPP